MVPLLTIGNSTQLACDFFGEESHPLLVLISGAGGPAEFWPGEFCGNLASSGLRVLRYSHRDTGLSTHFDQKYPIEELLQDLRGLLAELGNPAAHLMGHSMGGYLAQMAACRFPEIVASVTSVSAGSTVTAEDFAGLGMSTVTEDTWQVLLQNKPEGDFEKDLPGWLATWGFLNGSRAFDEDLAIAYTRSLYVGDPRNSQVAVNHVHAMSTVPRELIQDLEKVQCPFLVIHGTEDVLVPMDNGEATARLVPGSELIRLEGAGHMFFGRQTWREIESCLVSRLGF
jgi:pimeloyl-ACP methyl ester carboxylesterase